MARRQRDQYYTDELAIRALLAAYPDLAGDVLGDPCCGDGRMVRMLAPRFRHVVTNDINPAAQADFHMDAVPFIELARVAIAQPVGDELEGVAFWVSNPPFFAAGDITRASLDTARRGVAMLLRCTFLEPCGPSHACRRKRPVIPCSPDRCLRNGRRWITETPPTRILSIPRISFTGDGQSDSAPAWWFVWLRGADGAWQRGTIEVMERPTGQLGLGLGDG